METIFDHNPTKAELDDLIGDMSKEEYLLELDHSPEGDNLLFVALLYELRENYAVSSLYSDMVPDLYQQWQLGLDNLIYPVD